MFGYWLQRSAKRQSLVATGFHTNYFTQQDDIIAAENNWPAKLVDPLPPPELHCASTGGAELESALLEGPCFGKSPGSYLTGL